VAAGHLEHILPHLPEINDLHAKGFDANFDLKLPKDLHGAEWFSKATVKRFISNSGLFFILSLHFTCRKILLSLILFCLSGSCMLLIHQIQ
jgi:hypothetical protein